jgi:hypothetical protein
MEVDEPIHLDPYDAAWRVGLQLTPRSRRRQTVRILALVTFASMMAGLFGAELLDTIGVPGIWFPFGIGVSRTQYVYAIAIPLVAFLIVQTLLSKRTHPEATGTSLGTSGSPRTPRSRLHPRCAGSA